MVPEPLLLVDDEPELRSSLREALQADGYTVEEADSAEMALAMIARTHYPVVVTDFNMPPGKSGLDLIEAGKASDPRALFIVITGFATMGVSIEALKRGAYDFLQKPFKLEELEAVLDRALECSRLQRRVEAYRSDLESKILARAAEMKAFREHLLQINALLLQALDETAEGPLVKLFLDDLQDRFAPDEFAMFLPESSQTWSLLEGSGGRSWTSVLDFPPPDGCTEIQEWGQEGGIRDGFLVPLRHAQRTLGMLFMGFATRSSFSPEDPIFELWCSHLTAALYGLSRMRANAANRS